MGEPETAGKVEESAAIIPMNIAMCPLPFFSFFFFFSRLFFRFFFFLSLSDSLSELAALAEALRLYSHLLPFLQLPFA